MKKKPENQLMGKRFTDTAIWNKRWFRMLSPAEKCAFFYMKDLCDAVGIWDGDTELAEHFIGEKVDWQDLQTKVNGNIEVQLNGKWFLIDFCDFQYGELDYSCKPHRSYLQLLKKHGLLERVLEGYGKGYETLQEKEQEKEKEKDLEKEKEQEEERPGKVKYADRVSMLEAEYDVLVKEHGLDTIQAAIEKLDAYKLSSGKRYKSDAGALRSWAIRQVLKDKLEMSKAIPRETAEEKRLRLCREEMAKV